MGQLNYSRPKNEIPKIKGLLKEYKRHEQTIYSFAITPDRKYIITGSFDKSIKVWELESGVSLHTLEDHDQEVTAVNISSD